MTADPGSPTTTSFNYEELRPCFSIISYVFFFQIPWVFSSFLVNWKGDSNISNIWETSLKKLGGGNAILFIIFPENWGRVPPILTCACFGKGLVNNPPTRLSWQLVDFWWSCRAQATEKNSWQNHWDILLMATRNPGSTHQLREVGSWNPIIYKVLAPSKRWLFGWDFWTNNRMSQP